MRPRRDVRDHGESILFPAPEARGSIPPGGESNEAAHAGSRNFAGCGVLAFGVGQAVLEAAQGQAVDAPAFEVDPFWPKPLPNHWILARPSASGVDSKDHVFIVHRGFPTLTARTEAGLDTNPRPENAARLHRRFSSSIPKAIWSTPGAARPGYTWPLSNHGISVDHKDNVWIGGNGTCSDSLVTAGPARRAEASTPTSSSSAMTASSCCRSACPTRRPTARA